MIAHACWIGMISSCYCSQLDTQKMIQNAMSLQTLLGINLRTLHSPPLACSFPIERTNCFVHTHTHAYTFMHTWRRTCMHQYIATLIYTCIHWLMRTFIHACIHACIHMCIHLTHRQSDALAYILPTYIHADLQTFLLYVLETSMQACIHTWIHRCIQMYILRNRHFYVPHAVIPSLFSLNTHTWTSLQAYIPPQLHPYMHAHCTATKLHLPTCLQAYAPRHVHTCRHKYMHACIHACIPA